MLSQDSQVETNSCWSGTLSITKACNILCFTKARASKCLSIVHRYISKCCYVFLFSCSRNNNELATPIVRINLISIPTSVYVCWTIESDILVWVPYCLTYAYFTEARMRLLVNLMHCLLVYIVLQLWKNLLASNEHTWYFCLYV